MAAPRSMLLDVAPGGVVPRWRLGRDIPAGLPGRAGVPRVIHPEDTVYRRAMRFVEVNPAFHHGAAVGRGGKLLVEPAPPDAAVG